MSRWLLGCPECAESFTYAEVTPEAERNDFDLFLNTAKKPDFPADGLEVECPRCNKKSRFYRNQLKYEK